MTLVKYQTHEDIVISQVYSEPPLLTVQTLLKASEPIYKAADVEGLLKERLERCEREHTTHTDTQHNLCDGYKLACNELLAQLGG